MLNIKIFFVNTRGYPHNEYVHEYEYEYEANIGLMGRVLGSYYPYPTYPVDILMLDIRIKTTKIFRMLTRKLDKGRRKWKGKK